MDTQTTRRSTTWGLGELTQEESDGTVNRWSPNDEPPTTEDVKAWINEAEEEENKLLKQLWLWELQSRIEVLWQTIDSESSVDAQDGDYTPPSEHLTALQLDVPGSSVPTSDINSRYTSQLFSKWKASDMMEGDLQRQGMQGLKPRDLKEYRGKNLREHKNYVCNYEMTFRLWSDWFSVPDQCILWAQQYLTEELKDAYYREVNSKGLISTWKNYKQFFLDLIENLMNH